MMTDNSFLLFVKLVEPLGCLLATIVCFRCIESRADDRQIRRRRSGWKARTLALMLGLLGFAGRAVATGTMLLTSSPPTEMQLMALRFGALALEVAFVLVMISLFRDPPEKLHGKRAQLAGVFALACLVALGAGGIP